MQGNIHAHSHTHKIKCRLVHTMVTLGADKQRYALKFDCTDILNFYNNNCKKKTPWYEDVNIFNPEINQITLVIQQLLQCSPDLSEEQISDFKKRKRKMN